MLPKVIFFDLDDTLISFDGSTNLAWEKVCKSFVSSTSCSFSHNTLLDIINQIRTWYWGDPERHRIGRMDLIKARRDIVKAALEKLDFSDEESVLKIADGYSKLHEESICLFPSSINTLEILKLKGVRMGLITNGSALSQRTKINRFCLGGYFEHCFIEEEVGVGKPDIRVFQMALERMEVSAEDTWMVGDNLVWDIAAPQKVGIFSIWNDYNGKGLPKDSFIIPDRIINNISELVA